MLERLAALADARQHVANGLAILGRDLMKQFAAGQIFVAAARRIQRLDRGAVGFDDPQIGRGHDQDRLVRGVEHQPVARLDLAQLPVVALHGLLRGDQARLQFGDRLQVLADRQHAGAAAEQHGGEFHRNFEAARKALVDLAERRNAAGARVVDHALDLVAAACRRRFRPRGGRASHRRFRRSSPGTASLRGSRLPCREAA